MIKVSSDNAQQGLALTKEAVNIVQNVDKHMEQMIEAINEITRSSEQTSKIIKTIDEIAFQTNLLSMRRWRQPGIRDCVVITFLSFRVYI